MTRYNYEDQGTGYDSGAAGYELMGRQSAPRRDRRWNSKRSCWEYPVVDHLDGDPTNNELANLLLVWPSDNARVRASAFREANREPGKKT